MHIAVCDDEPATLAYLSELVRRWGEGRADPVRVERFPSAQALWFEWEAKPCFDLFFARYPDAGARRRNARA